MEKIDLDTPILNKESERPWCLKHACTGVFVAGGTGSGKSSGSSKCLAVKYLKLGMGGVVLTAKPTEAEDWKEYAQLAGRSEDLVIIEPGGNYHFNFLEYISQKSDTEKAITANIVNVLKTVIEAAKEKDAGVSNDPFWQLSLDMVMTNVISLCSLAYGKVTIPLLYDLVQDLPRNGEQKENSEKPFKTALALARERVKQANNKWHKTLTPVQKRRFKRNAALYNETMLLEVDEARQFKLLHQFFYNIYLNVSDKTRSIIDFIFLGFLMPLLQEPAYSIFCSKPSNVVPEDCLDGKVIVLNLPVKIYEKIGRDCQLLFKYIFQKSMEKRSITENDRPVFLWQDESQLFIMDHDTTFQATSRSSRVCSVYITQNLANYYACMSGNRSEFRVKSLLGNLATKIFHANADVDTNNYASTLVGDGNYIETSKGKSHSKEISLSSNQKEVRRRFCYPEAFVKLQCGGKINKGIVTAIIHVQGDPIFDGFNHSEIQFTQSLNI